MSISRTFKNEFLDGIAEKQKSIFAKNQALANAILLLCEGREAEVEEFLDSEIQKEYRKAEKIDLITKHIDNIEL